MLEVLTLHLEVILACGNGERHPSADAFLCIVLVELLSLTWVMPCLRQGSRSLLIQGR